MRDQQRALAEVIEHQRRRRDAEPRPADGLLAEVSHVRVERLGAGDGEQHRAQHDEGRVAVAGGEPERVARIECRQHRGRLGDVPRAHGAQAEEPERAHRPEEDAHHAGPVPLDEEERHQDPRGERNDVRLERRGSHLQAFHGREHGDGRRQHRVAVEKRRPEHAARQQRRAQPGMVAHRRGGERQQRHDAALPAVVGAQHEAHVLERHHDHQRPEDRRDASQDVLRGERDAVLRIEGLLDGVERARADVAVHHAQGEQRQGGGALAGTRLAGGRRARARGGRFGHGRRA